MPDDPNDILSGGLVPRTPRSIDPSERVRQIASRAQISPDVADDYLKTTQVESGHNVNVRDSSKGAQGFGQVMPDRPGGTIRTVGGRQYNLRNPDENIEAGLRYFNEGGPDPVSRRLYYFGGPKAKRHYESTGQIPNISDGNMSAAQYVKATGGSVPNRPIRAQEPSILSGGLVSKSPASKTETPDILSGGLVEASPSSPASPDNSGQVPASPPLTTNDAAWHFGTTPDEARRLTPKAQQILSEAVAEDQRKKAAGQQVQQPSLKYQNDMRKAAGLRPLKYNIVTDETKTAPYYQPTTVPFMLKEKAPIQVKPRPFTFQSPSDEQIKESIRREVLASARQDTHLHPEAGNDINQTDIENIVNQRFADYKANQASETTAAQLGPSMQARQRGIGERVSEKLGDVATSLNIDTPMGLKTDVLRGAAKGLLLPVPSRTISPEEKLVDPSAEAWQKSFLGPESVGELATAFIPYVGAGKLVSKLGVASPVLRDALTFGVVDAAKQFSQTGKIDPQSVAESLLMGGAMGKIAGLDPSLKRRIVAYLAPQVAVGLAKGQPASQIAQGAVTNLGFALAGGTKGEPSDLRVTPKGEINAGSSVPSGRQQPISSAEPRQIPRTQERDVASEISSPLVATAESLNPDVAGSSRIQERALAERLASQQKGLGASEATTRQGVDYANQIEAQPNVTAQPESAESVEQVKRSRQVVSEPVGAPARVSESSTLSPDVGTMGDEGSQAIRHVDLQPRRVRGEGKGQFKAETRAQREGRLAQVNSPATPSEGDTEGKFYEQFRATDQKDYNQKVNALEAYLSLDKERAQISDKLAGYESDHPQYKLLDKKLDEIDRNLNLEVDQATKRLGVSAQDFISLVNEFESNKAAVTAALRPQGGVSVPEGKRPVSRQEATDLGYTQRDPSDVRTFKAQSISDESLKSHLRKNGFKADDTIITPKGEAEIYQASSGLAYSWKPKTGKGRDGRIFIDDSEFTRHPTTWRDPQNPALTIQVSPQPETKAPGFSDKTVQMVRGEYAPTPELQAVIDRIKTTHSRADLDTLETELHRIKDDALTRLRSGEPDALERVTQVNSLINALLNQFSVVQSGELKELARGLVQDSQKWSDVVRQARRAASGDFREPKNVTLSSDQPKPVGLLEAAPEKAPAATMSEAASVPSSPESQGSSARSARGATPATEQALQDWREGRAYIDGRGNYHVKAEGKPSGPIAPWNKEAKSTFANVSELHRAANLESRGEEPWQMTKVEYARKWHDAADTAPPKADEVLTGAQQRDARLVREGHLYAVRRAVEQGKPVPPEVLADYPDLSPQPETKASAPPQSIKEQISYQAKRQQVIDALARDEFPYKGWDTEFPDLAAERKASVSTPETKVEPAAPTERIQPSENATPAVAVDNSQRSALQTNQPERVAPTTQDVRSTETSERPPSNATIARPELEPSTTSARKSQLAEDRAQLDLPELPSAERKSWRTSLANAKPERAALLADEVLTKPRSLNDEETASLVVRAQEIKNEHAQTMKEIGESSDPDTIAAKKAQADALEREFDKITRATKASGTEKGRTLAAQKLTINQDYDLVSLVQRAKAAKGRDLNPAERERYEQMASQIEDLNKQLSEANEKAQKAQLQRSIDKVKRQTRRAETKATLDTEFASLKSQLAQAKLETRSGVQPSLLASLDPEGKLTPIIARMAKNRVRAGINSAEGLVDEVFNAVKDHYDVSRDDIATLIRGTLHQPDDVLSRWDKRRQSQLLKQQGEIESRLATSNFSPKPSREAPIYNRETFKLQRQVNELKAKYDREMYRATRGVTGKLIDTAAGFGNIPKTMLSMADVSAVLRQGGIGVYQHPILSGKAGVDMLKSFTSHGFANVENAIKNSPRFDQAKRSGVEFTGVDKDNPQLSKHEEGYLGSGAIDTLSQGRLNPLRVVRGVKDFSERTFVSFLDSQRMRIFEQQAKALEDMGLKGKDLDAALRSQAKYINIITGRGSLGARGNQAAPVLNVAMFSPRLIASRFQFLNKMANPVAWANMPKGARKLQMIDNAKFLFGVASTLALAKAAGASINLDPDDSDFLKVKTGNTRYDVLAGLQQPMRFMYRMARAVKGGETYEGEDKGKIVGDFARSKAAPLAGYAADYLEGKNRLSGKKFEAGKDLVRNLIPLPFQDFQEAIKEDGTVRGIAEAFPTLLGVGTQTYPTAPEKAATKGEKFTRKLIAQKMPDEGRTQEEIDKDQNLAELRAQARRGVDVTKALEALKGTGAITDKTEKSILSARGQTRLQSDFKRLGLKEALLAYSTYTPAEQNSVKKILGEKAITVDVLPAEDQKDVRAKLESYGFKPGMQIPKRPTVQRAERPNLRAWSAP